MAGPTFLTQWDLQVRRHATLADLHTPGVARSYPLLATENGRVQTRFFFHMADQVGPNLLHLGPPLTCVVMDLADGTLLSAHRPDYYGIEPFEPIMYNVPLERRSEVRTHVQRLHQLYDVVVARFPGDSGSETGLAFWEALRGTVPPVLIPAYQAISPAFIAWLQT